MFACRAKSRLAYIVPQTRHNIVSKKRFRQLDRSLLLKVLLRAPSRRILRHEAALQAARLPAILSDRRNRTTERARTEVLPPAIRSEAM